MRLFILKDLDEYDILISYLVESDQPVFIFRYEENENLILVSEKDLNDVDQEIENILKERRKDSHPEEETSLEEIFDYNDFDDDEDNLIMLFL